MNDESEVLGEGLYGKVLRGEYRGTQIAVKRMLPPRSSRYLSCTLIGCPAVCLLSHGTNGRLCATVCVFQLRYVYYVYIGRVTERGHVLPPCLSVIVCIHQIAVSFVHRAVKLCVADLFLHTTVDCMSSSPELQPTFNHAAAYLLMLLRMYPGRVGHA